MQATQIVDKLLNEVIDPESMMKELSSAWAEDQFLKNLETHENISLQFGWSIGTGSGEMVELNLQERGLTPDDLGGWRAISEGCWRIERNLIKLLSNSGITLREEGHSDNDLIGSGWFDTKMNARDDNPINKKGLEFATTMLSGDEPLNTSSGSIMMIEGADKFLFDGVDARLADAADVSFSIFDHKRLQAFIEAYEDGTPFEQAMATINAIEEAKKQPAVLPEHPFLAPPEPSGIFRKDTDGVIIFSARCPGCKRIHGNFRTYDEAAGNRQCKFCTRDFVDKMTKVAKTGNIKHILQKDHEARASR